MQPFLVMRHRTVTQTDFDALLKWLDTDRDRAASRYEEIRSALINVFRWRGSLEAEELADETINRVTAKISELAGSYSGNPVLYFYGVAKNVYRESLRAQPVPVFEPKARDSEEVEDISDVYSCLESCMNKLPPETRAMIISYYEGTGRQKILYRKHLAREMGIDLNALRIRMHRIRARLQECVHKCLDRKLMK
jgi:DNA-directed RNA polymerase specialized sigma24 family protein